MHISGVARQMDSCSAYGLSKQCSLRLITSHPDRPTPPESHRFLATPIFVKVHISGIGRHTDQRAANVYQAVSHRHPIYATRAPKRHLHQPSRINIQRHLSLSRCSFLAEDDIRNHALRIFIKAVSHRHSTHTSTEIYGVPPFFGN